MFLILHLAKPGDFELSQKHLETSKFSAVLKLGFNMFLGDLPQHCIQLR